MSEADFQAAAAAVKACGGAPSNDEKLKLYGLYKQATEGDNTRDAPGMFALEAKAKHAAWLGLKGKSQDEARAEYIAYAREFVAKYNN